MKIGAARGQPISNTFKIDESDEQEIAMFPDCSHLVKNMRNGLQKYDFILPKWFVEKHKLPSRFISIKHVLALKDFQDKHGWKISPKLNAKCFPTGNFDKMKVGPAVNLMSRDTAAGIRFLVKEYGYTIEALTTAFFLEWVGRWFDFVSSRNSKLAFSRLREDKYQETLDFLNDFCEMIDSLTFMDKNGDVQKPIQLGIKLHTKSLLHLQDFYINVKKNDYLLPGRLGSDCIENYFSQIRAKNPSPTPMEFLRAFKALLIMHHMKPNKYGSYMEDVDSNWLTELKDLKDCQLEHLDEDEDEDVYDIIVGEKVREDFSQESALVYVAGYVLKKTVLSKSKCVQCQEFYTQDTPTLEVHKLVCEKEYKEGLLVLPTEKAWKIFSMTDATFNLNELALKGEKIIPEDIVKKLALKFKELFPELPSCHLHLVLRRFLHVKSHFWARQLDLQEKGKQDLQKKAAAASKTMGGYYQQGYFDYQSLRK